MVYHTHIPAAPLSQFVDWCWFFEGLDMPHRRERVLPDGSADLIINLDDSRRKLFDPGHPHRFQTFRRAWLSGARSDCIVIDVRPQSSMIGVHFKPGGLAPFVPMPAAEFSGQVVELDSILGKAAGELRDALLEAPGPKAKFRVLEDFLRRQAAGRLALNAIVADALREFRRDDSALSMRQVAGSLGISHKHFVELFRREVGLTPKRFWRIRRLQRLLAAIRTQASVDWPAAAGDAGYYDQAHFVNDFKEFSGLTPTDYVARRNGEMNFVPADD